MKFGEYLRSLRHSKNLRQADLANEIGVSTVYVCDIEKGGRMPPKIVELRKWAKRMSLTQSEEEQLYDLAGEARMSLAPDIMEYLLETPAAKHAIRKVIQSGQKYDWENMIASEEIQNG